MVEPFPTWLGEFRGSGIRYSFYSPLQMFIGDVGVNLRPHAAAHFVTDDPVNNGLGHQRGSQF